MDQVRQAQDWNSHYWVLWDKTFIIQVRHYTVVEVAIPAKVRNDSWVRRETINLRHQALWVTGLDCQGEACVRVCRELLPLRSYHLCEAPGGGPGHWCITVSAAMKMLDAECRGIRTGWDTPVTCVSQQWWSPSPSQGYWTAARWPSRSHLCSPLNQLYLAII